MKLTSWFRCISAVVLVSVSLAAFSSCVTEPTRRRGSLSDAMDKSRDDHEGSRTVPSEPAWPDTPDYQSPQRSPSVPADYPRRVDDTEPIVSGPVHMWLGIRGGNSELVSGDFGSRSDGDILLMGQVNSHFEGALYAGYKAPYPRSGTELHASVKDSMAILKAGVETRWQPLPALPVFSPYLAGQLGAFIMTWDFRNTLSASDGDISSDSLTGLHLACGLGAYILNLERFRIGASMYPETMLFGPLTNQGFDNDYFTNLSTIRLGVELLVRF